MAFTDSGHGSLLGELDNGVLYETANGGTSWRRAAFELHAITVSTSKISGSSSRRACC